MLSIITCTNTQVVSDMAMGWVNPWVGLGWVEDFHNYSGFGWVKVSATRIFTCNVFITLLSASMANKDYIYSAVFCLDS